MHANNSLLNAISYESNQEHISGCIAAVPLATWRGDRHCHPFFKPFANLYRCAASGALWTNNCAVTRDSDLNTIFMMQKRELDTMRDCEVEQDRVEQDEKRTALDAARQRRYFFSYYLL